MSDPRGGYVWMASQAALYAAAAAFALCPVITGMNMFWPVVYALLY